MKLTPTPTPLILLLLSLLVLRSQSAILTTGIYTGPRQIPLDEAMKDPVIIRLDTKLNILFDLAGFEIRSVTKQIVAGANYVLGYYNRRGRRVLFQIFQGFDQMKNTSKVIRGIPKTFYQYLQNHKQIPKSQTNLFQPEFEADPYLISINRSLISTVYSEIGPEFELYEVYREQTLEKNMYTFLYRNSKKGLEAVFGVEWIFVATDIRGVQDLGGALSDGNFGNETFVSGNPIIRVKFGSQQIIKKTKFYQETLKMIVKNSIQLSKGFQVQNVTLTQENDSNDWKLAIFLTTFEARFSYVVKVNVITQQYSIIRKWGIA